MNAELKTTLEYYCAAMYGCMYRTDFSEADIEALTKEALPIMAKHVAALLPALDECPIGYERFKFDQIHGATHALLESDFELASKCLMKEGDDPLDLFDTLYRYIYRVLMAFAIAYNVPHKHFCAVDMFCCLAYGADTGHDFAQIFVTAFELMLTGESSCMTTDQYVLANIRNLRVLLDLEA